MKNLLQDLKSERVFSVILILCLLSSLRSLFVPLQGDERTYFRISENILKGKYYLSEYPSTVTPIIPFMLAFLKINAFPGLGVILAKLFNVLLTILGFRYLYRFLQTQNIDKRVVWSVIALTAVNTNSISWFSVLYPEAILFFCFWGIMFYSSAELNNRNVFKMLALFLLLCLTRYLYLVLGVIILFNLYTYLKSGPREQVFKVIQYCTLFIIPVAFWVKYVYSIEQNNLSEISYFNRFKTDNQLLYNLKAGIGLIQHYEAGKINGIPAFVSLFVPVTGLRNFFVSILLIIGFMTGYLKKGNSNGINILFASVLLVMLGLVFAGTGFSRYWLVLLPGFILGYYLLAARLKIKDLWFVYAAQLISFVYIINEIRLDFLVISKYV